MKAAFIRQVGPPEVIEYGDLPDPVAGPGQVLVRVRAVSVNPIDTYIRAGLVKWELPFPFVFGSDLAGVVEAVGPGVTGVKVGDRVFGSNQGMLGRQGTFSELAAVGAEWLYPLPATVSFEDAAALALVGITAHLGLVREANVRPGETVFVSGGTGGVGSVVVQMAKSLGARVVATAGDDAKAERCRDLGADHVVQYKSQDVAGAVRAACPGGVDVWFETRRDADFELAVPLLAERGRFVLMAGRDAKPTFPVGPFYTRDCKLLGFAMFNAPPEEQCQAAAGVMEAMTAGKLRATIDRVMPLSEAAAAHRLQEENTVGLAGTLTGKIVLRP